MATLHYIHDPLCGWCYAAEGMVDVAVQAGVPIVLHGGGLFASATHLPAAKRDYIRQADARIGSMSGQEFGAAYLDGLLADPATLYDSRPPIAAILAAQSLLPGSGPAMLKALQHAHYRQGWRIVETEVLHDVAASIGLERAAFAQAWAACAGAVTEHHIAASRALMRQIGAQGFPTFALEREGVHTLLRHEACYGKPQAFAEMLHDG